jgi:hypothetical protein
MLRIKFNDASRWQKRCLGGDEPFPIQEDATPSMYRFSKSHSTFDDSRLTLPL